MNPPSIADFKAYFNRDFPYGATAETVMDQDITNAIADAGFNFNSELFADQAQYSLAYLCLAAHFLVTNLRASSQGIAGAYSWLVVSKGAGSVSSGLSVPQYILDHPILAMYSKTNYGAKYLQLILPLIVGQVYTVCGQTQA